MWQEKKPEMVRSGQKEETAVPAGGRIRGRRWRPGAPSGRTMEASLFRQIRGFSVSWLATGGALSWRRGYLCWRAIGVLLWMAALGGLVFLSVTLEGGPVGESVHAWAFQSARGELELSVVDPDTGHPVPCRIHLRKSKGRPWRPDSFPFWHDHFVFPGQLRLKLPLGTYEFEIERGPEYAVRSGYFTIQRDSNDTKQVELPRFVDMASEGWYAGDLLACRPAKEMDLLMEAEDLFLAVRAESPGAKEGQNTSAQTGSASGRLGNQARQHRSGLLGEASGAPVGRRVHRPGLLIQQSGGDYLLVPLEGDFPGILPQKPPEKNLSEEKSPSTFSSSPFGPSATSASSSASPVASSWGSRSPSSPSKQGGLGGQAVGLSEVQLLQLLQAKAASQLGQRASGLWEKGDLQLLQAKGAAQADASPEADSASQPDRHIQPFHPSGQQKQWWMDVVWPYCWDLPLWLALGKVDSVQVLHSHFRRSEWLSEEKEGRPRDKARFPGRWGHGLWGQYIYFQILECGFRIPPSAGSGSGLCANPLGYNRVYVHLEGPPSWQSWWEHFRRGQVLVTNGPLLRPSVQGKLPGHEFAAPEGQKLELPLALTFSTRDPVPYVEIIQNGQVAHSVPFQEYQNTGRLPKIVFEQSGWFLVRALAETPPTYRLAMTGPYYVRIGPERRISRSAVQFFLSWLREREAMIQKDSALAAPELLAAYQTARQFWQDLLQKANAD